MGQVELEATHWSTKRQLSINILKISHSQAERLLRAPGTCIDLVSIHYC